MHPEVPSRAHDTPMTRDTPGHHRHTAHALARLPPCLRPVRGQEESAKWSQNPGQGVAAASLAVRAGPEEWRR